MIPQSQKNSDSVKYMQTVKYKNQYFYINLFIFMIIKFSLPRITKQTETD